ncbi:carotenoid 9 [Forsythia ovata]|uniref:Carotenoid 9 n=1 Tax=Forsythia ovata TaxID=205694 RepID=A0ABD1W1P3_9LAMI
MGRRNMSNFAPVEEIGEAIFLTNIEGRIPDDFPEGVYIRNGSNPLFGGLLSAVSLFGRTSEIWVEGEGMLHALYLSKSSGGSNWNVIYNNKYVGTDTFLLEKERKKPAFLPAVEGDPLAVLSSFVLNMLRFGIPNKHMSNTNVFEHSGKLYSIAENYVPQEIDILTLRTLGNWDLNGAWTRPFTSHPKYEKEEYARIGVMPRYGNAESIRWFPVVASCAFHIINCFEDGDELLVNYKVVVMACRAQESIIPGPELGLNKFEWFSRGLKHIKSFEKNGENPQDGLLFTRAYEWRLNMKTRGMKHGNLTGTQFSMDFPFINGNFVGLKNKYAYTQVVDSTASSAAGMAKYGGLAKLYFEERKLEFSLVYIVDAKQLSREAVAKIALPERVPYGFHGDFMSNIVLKI